HRFITRTRSVSANSMNEADPKRPPGEYESIVLLVDDESVVYDTVLNSLADQANLALHYCPDSREAVAVANRISPTVIFLDLVMPQIDGLTLLHQLRANVQTKDIPIIVLSTSEDPQIKAQAFAMGANDYLVKLPDKVELIARIRYHSKALLNLLQRD